MSLPLVRKFSGFLEASNSSPCAFFFSLFRKTLQWRTEWVSEWRKSQGFPVAQKSLNNAITPSDKTRVLKFHMLWIVITCSLQSRRRSPNWADMCYVPRELSLSIYARSVFVRRARMHSCQVSRFRTSWDDAACYWLALRWISRSSTKVTAFVNATSEKPDSSKA